MNWVIERAKNDTYTMQLNGINLYSKYNPRQEAEKFISKEVNALTKKYILFGLGLGYHAEALLKLSINTTIYIILADEKELEICRQYGVASILNNSRIQIVSSSTGLKKSLEEELQVIIPLQWLKAIGPKHPLFSFLEDIKIRQMSFSTYSEIMKENFIDNISKKHADIRLLNGIGQGCIGVLVASGPSLNDTIHLIKKIKDKCFILTVGSALKQLLNENIIPDAVIICDAQDTVVEQLKNTGFKGILFYLSTANKKSVNIHNGLKVVLFQEGYSAAIREAKNRNSPLLETGGSVATTGLSLLLYFNFDSYYLFGQDFGFSGESTHAEFSTSGVKIKNTNMFENIIANNGDNIYTTSNLRTYHRWFEKKISMQQIEIYNTAHLGAKIKGAPYILNSKLLDKFDNVKVCNLRDRLIQYISPVSN
ncbi:motility associated factor glycosyltransferase family protein [Viridibacillus arvi]|uniref:motility associated factor glycosyltransferase family protein n=1 Tax=Viridibacillus arvi TaxID=263475 RepID=UPI003D00E1D1